MVVGGGVAGLVCAIDLHRAGRAVLLVEREAAVGGRVQSTHRDGLTLDHGFQVLFTAYPTLNRYLDQAALALRPFQPAAHIVRDGRAALIGDALADPSLLWPTLRAGLIPLADTLRLAALRRFARGLSIDACLAAPYDGQSTRAFLEARGFSRATIDGFFAPFYGGILLDRSLTTSASVLLFTFRMLAEGRTAVPMAGMGAITAHLAAQLPAGTIRTGVGVQQVTVADGRVAGVLLTDGTVVDATDVVLATDAAATVTLAATAGVTLPAAPKGLGCTTLYYTTTGVSPIPGRALWLNANAGAVVSHAVTLTEVAPSYAPAGTQLIAATVVGAAADQDDASLDAAARRELQQMAAAGGIAAGAQAVRALQHVATWRVPFSQFVQPPGSMATRPGPSIGLPGLWRAGEQLHSSSLEGAARGGQLAAAAVLAR